MHLPVIFTFIAVQVAAQGNPFQAPGPNDVRSPCPALNSLANHGYLPHNGKKISVPMVVKAFKDVMNVGADATTPIGTLGLQASHVLLSTTFNLDDLKQHNFPFEHDGSLSRQDAFFNKNQNFDADIWAQTLSNFDGLENATIPAAANARFARANDSFDRNPKLNYGARQLVTSFLENALFLSVLGNPISGNAPMSFVRPFFEEERLPFDEGWTRPDSETNLETLGAMTALLQLAKPEAVPEGLQIGTQSITDVLNLIDPLTGKVTTVTCALLGLC